VNPSLSGPLSCHSMAVSFCARFRGG
jgi:hypothetical protein